MALPSEPPKEPLMHIARMSGSILVASFVMTVSACAQGSATRPEPTTSSAARPTGATTPAVTEPQRQAIAVPSGDDAASLRKQLAELDNNSPILNPERQSDPEYVAVQRARETLYITERIQLIGLVWRAEPGATDLDELMQYRWDNSRRIPDLKIDEEVETYAAMHPHSVEAVESGRFQVARAAAMKNAAKPELAVAVADEFITQYPADIRGAELLTIASAQMEEAQKAAVNDRIADNWPDSTQGKRVLAKRRRDSAVGKPIELAFSDHLTGQPVSMSALRGKVVVVDFWATWCGPCKAELPHMKDLYRTYHDSGLEIVGVSLDQSPEKSGDAKLTSYCHENNLTWLQYYQGNYWDSEFSKSWGIDSIPAVFIVDRKGILRSVNARGKLDELIPQLLAEPATE